MYMDIGYPGYKNMLLEKKAMHQTYKTSQLRSKYKQKILQVENTNKGINLLHKKNKILYNKNKSLKRINEDLRKKTIDMKANSKNTIDYYSSLLEIERSKRTDLRNDHNREIVFYQSMVDNLNNLILRKQEFNDWETIEIEDL